MYIKITELLEMAQRGMTKKQIQEHFGLDEKAYQDQLKKFSVKNRDTLKRYLIGNARRGVSIQKGKKEIAVLDTSYIFSSTCRFEELKNAVVLPKVYEQLVVAYQHGSKKTCKFMHMVLEEKIDVAFEKEVYMTESIPEYEDPADMEIISYAKIKAQESTTKIPVVYTADKVLALRCKQQGIKYVFVDTSTK